MNQRTSPPYHSLVLGSLHREHCAHKTNSYWAKVEKSIENTMYSLLMGMLNRRSCR